MFTHHCAHVSLYYAHRALVERPNTTPESRLRFTLYRYLKGSALYYLRLADGR